MGKSKLSLLGIKEMHLIINAPEGNTFTIEAESNWTVAQLKEQVCLETGIKFNQQNLIVGGKPLNEKVALADFGLENDSNIELLVNLQGGATSTMDPAIVELSKKYNHARKSAVNVMPLYHQEPKNAERDHAVTGQILDQERQL